MTKININDLKIRICNSNDVKDIYNLQEIVIENFKEEEKGINNIVAEVTFGNNYSLNNLKKLGYEIKTWYEKDKSIKRHILLKKI